MKLNKFIIHELQKEALRPDTKLELSAQLMPVNKETTELIETLVKSYRGDKLVYANLKKEKGKLFPDLYEKYLKSTKSDKDFIDISIKQMSNLETIIKSIPFSKGGYFFFTDYELNGNSFFTIFLIRDTSGKALDRTSNAYKINTIEYLETGNLAMACRINQTKYIAKENNHITFTRQKQQEVSAYFMNWINVEVLGSTTEYTNTLYTIINKVERPIDKETGKKLEIDELRSMVFDFASSNQDKIINLHSLSDHIYGDSEKLINFIEENDIIIDTEFRFDRTALRKFIQVNISADGINIKFSKGDLGNKIQISKENSDMVIIKSKEFAKAFIREKENEG